LGLTFVKINPTALLNGCALGAGPKPLIMVKGQPHKPDFPDMPDWFQDNRHFGNIASRFAGCRLFKRRNLCNHGRKLVAVL
jgi:hypothetical protein